MPEKPPEQTTIPGPPSELVWQICPYLNGRDLKDCKKCPKWETDPHFGHVQRGCYALAEEVVNIIQTGNPWRNPAHAD